ncbi:MAG TPA: VWA domain-containing protein [Thermoanaerobaculia bacterium]|nr:VWA domain-containing protein [Thermoanaerobaculia bacterium]
MSRLSSTLSTLFLLLTILVCVDAAALDGKSTAPDKPDPTASLQPRHREFLEEAGPLLSDTERQAFLGLPRDYQRDAFIRRFWEVRDPYPKTARNELHEQWLERLKMAKEQFSSTTEDRARVLLLAGPPRSISHSTCDALLPLEFWDYDGTDKMKRGFTLAFVSPNGSSRGPWRVWYPSEGLSSLMAVELRLRSTGGAKDQELISSACPQADDVLGRLGGSADWGQLQKSAQLVPRPGEEWVATFLSRSTDVPDGAATFPARADFAFPGRFGSRTVVQGLVSVPRAEVRPERLEKASAYNFVVDGEVLYRGELFEQFRYRFLFFPEGEATADTFPLVFQRYLRPGTYTLVLKVEDTGGKRFWHETRELEIPPGQEAAALASAPAPAAPPPVGNSAAGALAEANAPAFGSDEQTIRILPPPPGLITGKVRVEARTTGDGISRVRFLLNGKPVLTKAKPPFSVELSLGDAPKIHTLEALALGAKDEKLAADQILLNTGPHRFAIRLVEPQSGKSYQASLRAQAQVELPEGERLDRVEIYLNETLLASLYQPPYVQPVILPAGTGVSYVRAVAYLADGNSTEDVVLINAPDYGEEVDVDFVELFTTVVDRKGKAVEGLTEKDFTVLENGVAQPVRRFELVRDLPIYAGIMIDTSSSMGENRNERLNEAIKAAGRFFATVIQPKDRAAVFTFSDTPTLGVRFTNQMDVLNGGLQGLTAEGGTALYDSLIYSLYYFGGIKGKKAIVLLSDGQDSGSHYSFGEALDYARRSGVAIYAVGIDMPQKDFDVRAKLQKLADETGGRSFFIAAATELERVFGIVEEELRSQYMLAYQSTNQSRDDKFRAIEVKLSGPGLEAKTVRGYYP